MFTPLNLKDIQLGPTPCNACPACPVESEGYSSGVGQDDRTGALCAMPCPPSHIAPFVFCAFASASSEALLLPFPLYSLLFTLCPMRHAPCAMLAIPLGSGNFLRRYPIKLHQLRKRVELFLFCLPHEAGP